MAETTTDTRTLDIEIAVELFGWEWWKTRLTGKVLLVKPQELVPTQWIGPSERPNELCAGYASDVPQYSTDPYAWLDVVKRLTSRGLSVSLDAMGEGDDALYACEVRRDDPKTGSVVWCATGTGDGSWTKGVCEAAVEAVQTMKREGKAV